MGENFQKLINLTSFEQAPDEFKKGVSRQLRNKFHNLGLNNVMVEGEEARKAIGRRKKAIKTVADYAIDINNRTDKIKKELFDNEDNKIQLDRIIIETLPKNVTDEQIKELYENRLNLNKLEYNASVKHLGEQVKKCIDEYNKPGHGRLNINQTDEELVNNFLDIKPIISLFEMDEDNIKNVLTFLSKNSVSDEDNKIYNDAIKMYAELQNVFTCLDTRYDLILSPFYELLGTTNIPTEALSEIAKTDIEGYDGDALYIDLSVSMLREKANYTFGEGAAVKNSINDLIKNENFKKVYQIGAEEGKFKAFDDAGELCTTGKKLLDGLKEKNLEIDPITENIYLKNSNDEWVCIHRDGIYGLKYEENLNREEQAEIDRKFALRTSERNQKIFAGLEEAVSVFTPKGTAPSRFQMSGKNKGKWAWESIFKYGEVYYRDNSFNLHHVVVEGTKLKDEQVKNLDYLDTMTDHYKNGLAASLGFKPGEQVAPDVVRMHVMEKSEPGIGINVFVHNKLEEWADILDSYTSFGRTSQDFENIIGAVRDLSFVYSVLSDSERKEAMDVIKDLADTYTSARLSKSQENNYTKERVDIVNQLSGYLKNLPMQVETARKTSGIIRQKPVSIVEEQRSSLEDIYKRDIEGKEFKIHNYAMYKALNILKGEETTADRRIGLQNRLEKSNTLKLMNRGLLADNKYSADELDKYYEATDMVESYIENIKDQKPDEVLAHLKECFLSDVMKDMPESYVHLLENAAVKQLNVIFGENKFHLMDLDADAYEKQLVGIFTGSGTEDFVKKHGGEEKAAEYISGLIKSYSKAGSSVNGKTLAERMINTYKETVAHLNRDGGKNVGSEMYNAIKKEYIQFRNETYVMKINEKYKFISIKTISDNIYGKNGLVDELKSILSSGNETFRGSSAMYKEIQSDLEKIINTKPGELDLNLRYAKVCLQAVAEKAAKYVANHAAREMKYPINSYEGRRIDNMRRIMNAVNAYTDVLENAGAYKSVEVSAGSRPAYTELIQKRFEESRFNRTLFAEYITAKVPLEADIFVADKSWNYTKRDAVVKNLLKEKEKTFDIFENALNGKKIDVLTAEAYFQRVDKAKASIDRHMQKIMNANDAKTELERRGSELDSFKEKAPEKIVKGEPGRILGDGATGIDRFDTELVKYESSLVDNALETIIKREAALSNQMMK